MSKLGHTVRQVSWSLVGYVVPMVSALFFTPLIIGGLGVERYGLLLLTMTTVGMMAMLDLGLGAASIREMSVARAKEDVSEGRRAFATIALIFLSLAAVGSAILLLIGEWLVGSVFTIPPGLERDALACVRLAALGLAINMITPPFSAFLSSAERFDLRARISVIATVTSTALVLWRGLQGDLVGAVLGKMVGSALGLTLQMFAARRIDPARVGVAFPDLGVARSLAAFSMFQMISSLLGQLTQHLSKLLLAAHFGTAEVAWFGTPLGLARRIPSLLASAAGVLYPRISALSASGDETAVPDMYRVAQKLITTFAISLCIPTAVMAYPLLVAWLGEEFASHATIPLTILGFAFIILSMDIAMVHTMLGINRPRDVVLTDLPPAIVNIGATFLFVKLFGINGAAMALIPAYLMLWFRFQKIQEILGDRGTEGIMSLVLKVTAIAVFASLALHPLASALVGMTVMGPLLAMGIACFITLGVVVARPGMFGRDVTVVTALSESAMVLIKRRFSRVSS